MREDGRFEVKIGDRVILYVENWAITIKPKPRSEIYYYLGKGVVGMFDWSSQSIVPSFNIFNHKFKNVLISDEIKYMIPVDSEYYENYVSKKMAGNYHEWMFTLDKIEDADTLDNCKYANEKWFKDIKHRIIKLQNSI